MTKNLRTNILVSLLWGLTLLGSIVGAFVLAMPHGPANSVPMPKIMLLMPLVFFGAGGQFARQSFFHHPKLALFINGRYGDNTLENFLVRLRPLLMLATGSLIEGLLVILSAKTPEAATVGQFFISAALGFALAHGLMYRRRLAGVYPSGKNGIPAQPVPVGAKLPLAQALPRYWKYLIGVVLFPIMFFCGITHTKIPTSYCMPFFLLATLLAAWPVTTRRAAYSFWVLACVLYLAGGLLAVCINGILHQLIG